MALATPDWRLRRTRIFKYDIGGRFNIDTTSDRNATKVLSYFVMSGSKDLISSMTRTEQVEYFKTGLEFLKTEYPSFHIVDSRIHFDEKGLPHMHTSMLPIHIKEDGTKTFNISQHQKGIDYFKGFQDRFYDYMKERYPDKDLERNNPERDHDKKLTVKEYKENEDMKRELEQKRLYLLERAERLNEIEKQIDNRFREADEIKAYNDEIDRYCREHGLTYYQYENSAIGLIEALVIIQSQRGIIQKNRLNILWIDRNPIIKDILCCAI